MAPATRVVEAALRRELADLQPGSAVLVAVSGGADSTALLASACRVGSRVGLRIASLTVDHGWYPESAGVAESVRHRAERLGASPALLATLPAPPAGGARGGPEAAARAGRYAALLRVAAELAAAAVLLGHTRDDQAETVLLRLARGSGPRALAGMPRHRGLLRRPLLEIDRQTTARACAELGLPVHADPANADPAYARSRVRHGALPALVTALGPGAVAGLIRTAALAAQDADLLEELAYRAYRRCLDPDGLLDTRVLAVEPPALRSRVLRQAALAAGCPAGALGLRHATALDTLVTSWRGQGPVHLPGGVSAQRCRGRIQFTPGARVPVRAAGSPLGGRGERLEDQPTEELRES